MKEIVLALKGEKVFTSNEIVFLDESRSTKRAIVTCEQSL